MANNYLCLSAADLHGNVTQYKKIKEIVIKENILFVFLCGDILPKDGGAWYPENKIRTIGLQRNFITSFLLDYLEDLSHYASIYAIFGNDDFKANYSLLENVKSKKVTFLNNQVVRLDAAEELYVAGYPYISLTPFLQKDWEKWDSPKDTLSHKIYRLEGFTSSDDQHYPIDFTAHEEGRKTISEDLSELAQKSNPKKTIYVFHEPPYNTPLDMISRDNKAIKNNKLHIGSKAIRDFIEKEQPLITMHGHIHETFQESGDYKWRYGNSLSITASNDFTKNKVAYVLFSLPTFELLQRKFS